MAGVGGAVAVAALLAASGAAADPSCPGGVCPGREPDSESEGAALLQVHKTKRAGASSSGRRRRQGNTDADDGNHFAPSQITCYLAKCGCPPYHFAWCNNPGAATFGESPYCHNSTTECTTCGGVTCSRDAALLQTAQRAGEQATNHVRWDEPLPCESECALISEQQGDEVMCGSQAAEACGGCPECSKDAALLQTAQRAGEQATNQSEGTCNENLCHETSDCLTTSVFYKYCKGCPICGLSTGFGGQTLDPSGEPDGKFCMSMCDTIGEQGDKVKCGSQTATMCGGCPECL